MLRRYRIDWRRIPETLALLAIAAALAANLAGVV
jgi:hypothetical protein